MQQHGVWVWRVHVGGGVVEDIVTVPVADLAAATQVCARGAGRGVRGWVGGVGMFGVWLLTQCVGGSGGGDAGGCREKLSSSSWSGKHPARWQH
jgi:hypothetical protein